MGGEAALVRVWSERLVALEWVTVVRCGCVDDNCCGMAEVEAWKAALRGYGRSMEGIAAWKTGVGG